MLKLCADRIGMLSNTRPL